MNIVLHLSYSFLVHKCDNIITFSVLLKLIINSEGCSFCVRMFHNHKAQLQLEK